jgi:hypothetical protein
MKHSSSLFKMHQSKAQLEPIHAIAHMPPGLIWISDILASIPYWIDALANNLKVKTDGIRLGYIFILTNTTRLVTNCTKRQVMPIRCDDIDPEDILRAFQAI